MRVVVSKRSVWSFLAVCINPVVGALFSLWSLISRSRPNHFAFALSLTIIYAYLPVTWDARNNFFRIYANPEYGLNFYTSSLQALTAFLGVPYIVAVATIAFLIIYIFSRVIGAKLYARNDYSNLRYFACLALFLGCIEFRAVFDIQKTTLALAFVLLAIDVRDSSLRIALFVLSALIHPFTIALAALVPIAYLVRQSGRPLLFIIFTIATTFGLFFSPDRAVSLVSTIAPFSERAALYLLHTESRYSSDSIALLVWALRVFAVQVVAIACILQWKTAEDKRGRYLLNFLAGLCLLTLIFSRNEIFAERFFLAIIILSAYVAVVVKFRIKRLLMICAAILLNVGMHGMYTLRVVHSEGYNVIGSEAQRAEMTQKPFYFPTPLLLAVGSNGYSNAVIWDRAR
ncbi:hypothetical protein LCGC14_1864780 [marine sediment metagenome]|uniref:EpsG family protein n=1 Tax=marine sediment metagenome TaxID=412755 RepID=A0A0F9J5E9_9ZZZZ